MPVIVMQVSRMNDPPQPWSLQFKGPFSIYAGGGLARMRGGPRQIQDSQKGVINKSAHKERGGGAPDFLILFYFQTNTFSALGTNGTWFASLLKANRS